MYIFKLFLFFSFFITIYVDRTNIMSYIIVTRYKSSGDFPITAGKREKGREPWKKCMKATIIARRKSGKDSLTSVSDMDIPIVVCSKERTRKHICQRNGVSNGFFLFFVLPAAPLKAGIY